MASSEPESDSEPEFIRLEKNHEDDSEQENIHKKSKHESDSEQEFIETKETLDSDSEPEYIEPLKKHKKYEEDDITFTRLQIGLMIFLVALLVYVIYEYEYVNVVVLKFYANVGDKDAQHILGQRYYLGQGVKRNKTLAFYWFKQAARQGHGHASYNLGVAHIQGFHRLERKGEAHELIRHAASLGIKEAEHVLKTACAKGECDR